MKENLRKLLGGLLALPLLTLSSLAHAEVAIVTTTTDLAAIAREVGGDLVSVKSLAPGTRDAHYLAAKPSMKLAARDADLMLAVGADLEIGWLPLVVDGSRNRAIQPGSAGYLDLSTTVTLLDIPTGPVDRSMGDVHPMGNPHYWLDPRNGITMARAIAERLSVLDPGNAARYREQADAFAQRVDERLKAWQEATGFLRGRKLISYHRSFTYLAAAFGFEIVGEVEPIPGVDPTARHLQELVGRVQAENIAMLIMEPYYEQESAAFLQRSTDIAVAVIPGSVGGLPGIETYTDLFDQIVSILSNAPSS